MTAGNRSPFYISSIIIIVEKSIFGDSIIQKKKGGVNMEERLVHSNLEFLKVLNRFTLESKLSTCQKYSCRIMTCSEVDMLKALKENIMPWEIEAFAAYSIVYDNNSATEQLDKKTFSDVITKIRNYWHSGLTEAEINGEYPDAFMMISALQQFPVQGLFLQKLFRYHYFFTFKNNDLDVNNIFVEKFGVNYEHLEEFAFLVFVGFSKEAQDEFTIEMCQCLLSKAFKDNDSFNLLSIEKDEYKKQLASLYQDNIIDQFYGLKIQYIFPFISGNNEYYVPSPYLVINAVTESMLNRLTFNDNTLRRAIGKEVIESYLYDIVVQLDTVTWISKEFKYRKGKNVILTPDVMAAEGGRIIFYDTKAISPSLKLRKFDVEEINKDITIYAEDVVQLYNQIQNYLHDLFHLDKSYDKENIFGIVVVLEDSVVSRKKVYEKAYSLINTTTEISEEEKEYICSHIKVLPLREIERMILQNTSIMPSLLSQIDTPDRWYNYTYSYEVTSKVLIPLYSQYTQDLKMKISKIVE